MLRVQYRGLTYKEGAHGRAFYFLHDEWKRSCHMFSDVQRLAQHDIDVERREQKKYDETLNGLRNKNLGRKKKEKQKKRYADIVNRVPRFVKK